MSPCYCIDHWVDGGYVLFLWKFGVVERYFLFIHVFVYNVCICSQLLSPIVWYFIILHFVPDWKHLSKSLRIKVYISHHLWNNGVFQCIHYISSIINFVIQEHKQSHLTLDTEDDMKVSSINSLGIGVYE